MKNYGKTVRHVGKSKKLMTKLWTHRMHGVGIYANGGILMGSMLPYIAAPWILWGRVMGN
jgi:hypothetical protein